MNYKSALIVGAGSGLSASLAHSSELMAKNLAFISKGMGPSGLTHVC